MSLARTRDSFEAFLERTLWGAGWVRLFLACIPLALATFLVEDVVEAALDAVFSSPGFPGHMDEIKVRQSANSWVGPLLVAPVLENLLCLFWVRVFAHKLGRSWWLVPCIVALIAAAFHVALYMEPRYASVFVDFFLMCCLIHNAKNRAVGFWASVFLHFLVNFIVLMQWRIFGIG
ncbi:hypothetical protein [Pseudoxanthomonas suwonensis]|uniref:hypothetical protein n=1 Tax=Pseudoxanthomonas suwonensis TaxID=314722 RepID=UPI00048F7245|nr:hypothetical protein [Pseudoxanthomonas suwonensis]